MCVCVLACLFLLAFVVVYVFAYLIFDLFMFCEGEVLIDEI